MVQNEAWPREIQMNTLRHSLPEKSSEARQILIGMENEKGKEGGNCFGGYRKGLERRIMLPGKPPIWAGAGCGIEEAL
jgi:hypothetical protein